MNKMKRKRLCFITWQPAAVEVTIIFVSDANLKDT